MGDDWTKSSTRSTSPIDQTCIAAVRPLTASSLLPIAGDLGKILSHARRTTSNLLPAFSNAARPDSESVRLTSASLRAKKGKLVSADWADADAMSSCGDSETSAGFDHAGNRTADRRLYPTPRPMKSIRHSIAVQPPLRRLSSARPSYLILPVMGRVS